MYHQEILDRLEKIENDVLSGGGKAKDVIEAQFEFIEGFVDPQIMEMEQRTDEWFEARLGVLSASTASDVMSKTSIERVINKNLAEMALEAGMPFPTTAPMQWGIDTEDEARRAYEKVEGVKVREVGFIFLNKDRRIGCSPDGLVGDEGMVEFKCPNTDTHMGYRRKGQPRNYFYQTQQQMMVAGRKYCDFVSFDPRVKNPKQQIFVQRIYRCKKTIVNIFTNLMTVCAKVDAYLESNGLTWDKDNNTLKTL